MSGRGHRPALGAVLPWFIAAALFIIAAVVSLPAGLSREAAFALAGLGAALVFWSTGAQDPSLTGLLIVTLFSLLGVMPFEQAVAGFGTEFVWLLAATFVIAAGMAEVGLGRRIALRILSAAGGRAPAVLLALMAAVLVLSFMVPTASGRVSMILPVCLGIIDAARITAPSNFARAMLIGTAHVSIMTGIGLPTAAGATVYAVGAFKALIGMQWTYVAWLVAFFPVVMLFVLALWRVLLWVFPPEQLELAGGAAYVRDELRRLGALSPGERKMLVIFAGMFLLWVAGPRWGITVAQGGTLGMLAMMLPGVRVLTWERALVAIRWNVIILFAVSLAIAAALERTGAGRWLTDAMLTLVTRPSPAAVVLIVGPLILLIRLGFVNNLGMIAVALPLAFTLARGWGLNPLWAGMTVVMTAGPGFLLPTQTPTGMISLGYQYYTIRDYLRAGIPASIVLILLTLGASLLYWPLLGYRP